MQEIKLLDSTMNSKNVMLSLLGCLLIYIFAILGGFLISLLFSELHILIIALIADIIATIIVYFFSMIFKNASLYDPYWSVQPIVITFYFFFFYDANPLISIRQIIVLLLVLSWGIRLTGNWIKGWKGINHEDWRYKEFRRQNPKWFWLINFFGIQMMPTLLVYFACLSIFPITVGNKSSLNYIEISGYIICILSIMIETIADNQLKEFRKIAKPNQLMNLKLWKYSRHPNYFGEIMFWWGLFIIGIASSEEYIWVIFGPILITLLFNFISIPMMEKRQLKNKVNYQNYQLNTPKLIPRFWRSKKKD